MMEAGQHVAAASPLIVVIDDDDGFRVSLDHLVQSFGFRTVAFPSAELFLDSVAREDARCILCDLQMPGGMDGLQLLRSVTAFRARVPFILMSAFSDEIVAQRARDAGAHCVLRKPFDIDHLVACIEQATGVS